MRDFTVISSTIISILAILISLFALGYARRSATAAEASARTAQDALSFQREERLSTLAREALEKWQNYGNLDPILSREKDLSPKDQEDLAYRVYRALGHSDKKALEAVDQWRQADAKK